MTGIVGQSVNVALDVGFVRIVFRLLGIAVGSVVVYQALRGYRRNDSRAMLFLGVGLFVLGPVHFAVTLVPGRLAVVALGIEALDVLGLALILYSLTRA